MKINKYWLFGRCGERLTAVAGVETAEGPRSMRVFNLLGAYVLCTSHDSPACRTIRRWLLETLVYFQIDVRREIRRLTEEVRAALPRSRRGCRWPTAAILFWLWRYGEGEWLETGTRHTFVRSLGMASGKSAEQGLARLLAWGMVEARPDGAPWPAEIRLVRAEVEAALRAAGLEAPE